MSPAAVMVGPVNVKPPRTAAGLPEETRDVGHQTHGIQNSTNMVRTANQDCSASNLGVQASARIDLLKLNHVIVLIDRPKHLEVVFVGTSDLNQNIKRLCGHRPPKSQLDLQIGSAAVALFAELNDSGKQKDIIVQGQADDDGAGEHRCSPIEATPWRTGEGIVSWAAREPIQSTKLIDPHSDAEDSS